MGCRGAGDWIDSSPIRVFNAGRPHLTKSGGSHLPRASRGGFRGRKVVSRGGGCIKQSPPRRTFPSKSESESKSTLLYFLLSSSHNGHHHPAPRRPAPGAGSPRRCGPARAARPPPGRPPPHPAPDPARAAGRAGGGASSEAGRAVRAHRQGGAPVRARRGCVCVFPGEI